jgi:hypothetical protein
MSYGAAMAADPLADWVFEVEELSAGASRGLAHDSAGRSVSLTRGDPDEVLRLLRERATELMERET